MDVNPGELQVELENIYENLPLPALANLDVAQDIEVDPELENIYDDVFDMDNFVRINKLKPPKFNARKSDVRRFFSKLEKYFQVIEPPFENDVIINVLSNLLDDNSLDFFDSLEEEIREDYDLLKEHFIEHYDNPTPLTYRWNELTKRKQKATETVTEFHDDLVHMVRMMDIGVENLLYIFVNGLPPETQLHLSLHDPPQDLTDALNRAKTFQAIKRTTSPSINSLYDSILAEHQNTDVAFVEKYCSQSPQNRYDIIEEQLKQLTEKIDCLNINQNIQTPCYMQLPLSPPNCPSIYPFNPNIQANNQFYPHLNNPNIPVPQTNLNNHCGTHNFRGNSYNNNDDNHYRKNQTQEYNNITNNTNIENNNNKNYNSPNNSDNTLSFTSPCNIIDGKDRILLPFDHKTMTAITHIEGKPSNILFDSGSAVSLISKKQFQYLNLEVKLQPPECHTIFGVDKKPVNIYGQITVKLQFSNRDYPITLLIIEAATFDVIIGRDWISEYVGTINYDNQIIKLHLPEKIQQCCTVVTDNIILNEMTEVSPSTEVKTDNIILKGFLRNTTEILAHTEVQTFLHLDDLPKDNTFKLTGAKNLVVEKNILVYDNDNISPSEEGIACTFSNFSDKSVTLEENSQMAWLEVLPISAPTNVMYTEVLTNNSFENCTTRLKKKSHFLQSTITRILNSNTKLLIFFIMCNFLLLSPIRSQNENSYEPRLNQLILEGTIVNNCNYSMENKTNVILLPDNCSLSQSNGSFKNLSKELGDSKITHFEFYLLIDETFIFHFDRTGVYESFSFFKAKNMSQFCLKISDITRLFTIRYKNTPFGKSSKMKRFL